MRKLLIVAYVHQFHHDLLVRWQANPGGLSAAIVRWCRGQATYDVFGDLKLPIDAKEEKLIAGAELAAIRNQELDYEEEVPEDTRFLDPSDPDIFWIGSIVRDLPDHLGWDMFDGYLSGELQ